MPNFDLDTYFANREARTLGVATPEGVTDLNAKQAQVASASAKKVQVLQELVERRENNERDTVVGWLGLDPNSTGGNVVNTAVSSLSAIEDIAGTVAPEAVREAIDMDGLIATQHDGTKPSSVQRRLIGDGVVSGLKSAIAVPEMAVGLADLVSSGHAGKALEEAGFRPEEAKQFLDTLRTHEQQAASGSVEGAQGFWGTLAEIAENPSVVPHAITESLFPMLAGGVVGRGLQALGMGVKAASAVGEGAVMAGSAAEGIRQQTEDGLLTPKQAVAAGLTGVMGAGVARLGNAVGGRMGLGDIDEAVTAGTLGTSQRNALARGAGGAAMEGAEETLQSAGEQMLQNVALDRELTEGVGNAAAMGLVTGAAMGSVMTGSAREANEEEVEKASETGNVSSLLQPGAYAPEKAAKALAEHSLKNEDAQVRQGNLAKLGEIRSALEDEAKAESHVERIQQRMESAPQEQQPQLEALLAQATESLTAIRAALGLQDVPAAERKEALAKQLDQVKQAEASITQLMEPEKQDLSSQIELADTVLENVTPEVQQTARKAAERVVSLAMESPEALDVEVATRLASNMANSLTEPERVVLRTFAKAKALAHQVKGLEGVNSDIFNGNPKEGYKGLNEYSRNVRRALAYKTPDLEAAQHEIDGLAKFVESRKAKLAVAQKAFDEVAGSASTQQWVRDRSGTWMPADRQYSYDEMYANGGMTIHGGSGNLVANIAQETEALEASLQSLQALYDMKSAAPVQTTVNQPEAAAPVAETEVPAQPVATGKLRMFDAPDVVSGTPAESYKQGNQVKQNFEQKSGEKEAEGLNAAVAGRPLVKEANFLSRLGSEPDLIEKYVPADTLAGEKSSRRAAVIEFQRLAAKWSPRLKASLAEVDPAYRYDDYMGFFIEKTEDGTLAVEENVETAMLAAGALWVAEQAAAGAYNQSTAINGMLGRDSKTTVTPREWNYLATKGTRANLAYNAIGQKVMQALGLKLKPNAPISEKAKLEASFGAHVAGLLMDQGVLERINLPGSEIQANVDSELSEDFKSKIHPFVRLARKPKKNKQDRETFTDDVEQILSMQKGSGNILTKLFGVEGGLSEPLQQPTKFKQESPNNTNRKVPQALAKILNEDMKHEHKVRKDMLGVVSRISLGSLERMAGIEDENALIPKALREGLRAKNDGIKRDIANALALFEELSFGEQGLDQPLFMPRSVWKHHRVGMDGNVLNPQASKVHRHLVAMGAWKTSIDVTKDTALLEQFKLAVMEAIGEKTDKQDNTVTLAKFDTWFAEQKVQDVLASLNQKGELSPEQERALVDLVEAGGEKLFTLDALVSAAAYAKALQTGERFETHFFREVDGKTNGAMLAHVQLGPFESVDEAFQFLNRGGFYQEGSEYQRYSQFRGDTTKGNMDLYESTARLIDQRVSAAMKAMPKQMPVYQALFSITGRLSNDDGSITSFGRNLVKQPDTAVVYGAGLNGTLNNMANTFIENTYKRLMKLANGKGKGDTLEQYIQDVNILLVAGGAKPLDTDMSLQQVLDTPLTAVQERALKIVYSQFLGETIKDTMTEQFGQFMARRDTLNQAAQLAFELYDAAYKHLRETKMQELIAAGDVAVGKDGSPLHDMNQEQEAEIRKLLAHMEPAAHTPFSKESGDLAEAVLMSKTERRLGSWRPFTGTAKFGFGVKSNNPDVKPTRSLNFAGFQNVDVNPGVAALVLLTQSTDSAVSAKAYAKLAALNVHDAHALGLKDVLAGGKNLNQATFEVMRDYSIAQEIDEMLERVVTGLAEMVENKTLPAEKLSFVNASSVLKRRYAKSKNKAALANPLTTFLGELRSTRLAADRMRLSTLERMSWVDQYSLQDGSYQVSEDDRSSVQQKLAELNSVAAPVNGLGVSLIDAHLKKALNGAAVPSAETAAATEELDKPEAPADQSTPWGELGKSPIEHDSELVQFFKSNPQPSLKDVLKALRARIEATSNGRTQEFNRELWKALAKHVNPAMKIVYVTPEMAIPEGVAEKQAQSARGLYSFSDSMDTLYIKSDAFRRSGVTTELLMHELVHSVVARTIDLAEQGKPLPDTAELVAELGVLLERSRQHVADKPELAQRYSNALSNVQEFVAWGMTNQGFQRDVLNQFTLQTKTSRNVLVKAMEALTNVLRDILFRGSDKSAQKIQVTGLKTLLANVSGLMATAEQARETVGTQRTLAMEDPVLDMDVADLFDGLRNTEQPLDVGFESHLRELLDKVVRPLHGPFGAVRLEALDDQAIGARERFLKALATGKAPFAAKLSDVVKLSDQEAFLAESIEVALRTALESKDRSSSLVYRELKGLYNEVKASLPVSAFFDGDWTQASDEQKAEAQALREFFLEIPDGEGQSDYLSRFAALGLAYRPLWKLLDRSTQQDTRVLRDLTWMQRLQALVERAMAYLAGKWTHTYAGQQANDKLKTLVGELVDIEAKYREKAARPNNQWIEMAENALAGAQGKAKDMIDQVAKSDMVRNSKISGVRLMGRVASLAADDRLEAVVDAGNQLRDRLFKGRQGLMAGMFNEMKGPNEIMLALLNFAKRNEQERKHLINWTRDMALGSFANEGKHLTAKDKDAMALLLRADLASLLDYGYSLEELQHLLSPNGSLQQRIAELGKQLKTSTHAAMYLRRAEALGKYMATGKASIDNLMLNADNIARMLGTKDAHSVPDAELDRVRPLIDQLASLYALANANESDKERIANVLATELQRTDGGNGVTFVLKMHHAMQQEAKEKLFENSEALFTKGYTPEIHNPHTEVLAATEEEGEALVRQGFQRVVGNPLNQDADDLDKRAKHLYILKGRGMQQRLTGALSYTGERAKGSRKHGGIVNTITGSLNTHNVQVTQRLAHTKRVREEMAIQQGKPMGGVHMVPVLNAAGEIVNYRYVMSNKARDSLLERTNAFDTLLGTLHGNVFDKQASREQNAQVVKALFDQWNADKDNRRDAYIMVGPDSSDAEGAETWRLLPHHTQEVIRQVWKGNNMMVRNDQIDLIAGYRKYSLADMFDKQERTTKGWKNLLKHQEDERNLLEQLFVWFTEDFLRLDKKAALRVRQAEDFWQAVVQEVKDIVVVRSGVTLFWNVVSNMTVLLWQGVPVKDLMRNHWVAWRGAVNYRKDSEELFRLEAALSTGTSGDAKAAQQRIRQLQDSLARNPAKELIDAGMLPTIVEDVALEEDPYSYRSMLKEKVDKYTSKLNPTVKQAAAFVYMAPGTSLHTAMSQATQYSDFVGRYTLYQHLINNKKAPKSKQEALKRISDSFVNYDVPSHRHMQYLNDMGLLMFTKYYLRIQKVIMQMFREHPARAIMMVTLDSYLHGMQTIVDSSMWGRLGNPLEWGALQYPGTLDELATIKGMMNLFK